MAIGDARLEGLLERAIEQVTAAGSLTVTRAGVDRAGEMSLHRLLSAPDVGYEDFVEEIGLRTAEQCAGLDILAVLDTTEVNFGSRGAKRRAFGAGGDSRTPAFFIHPAIAVDLASQAVIGLLDAEIWTRAKTKVTARHKRAITEKESGRWVRCGEAAVERVPQARSVTLVEDREADIYDVFACKPAGADLVVRAKHNRRMLDDERLFTVLDGTPALATRPVEIAARPGEPARVAEVELRAGPVTMLRPGSYKDHLVPSIDANLVVVQEVNVPAGKKPICWRLLTTHPVTDAASAARIVQLYRLRWRIEEVFRSLKGDGLQIEDCQIEKPERMFTWAAIGLAAAVKTMQLVNARDGSSRPATDVVDEADLKPLQLLSKKLEGKTARQKNPHPPASLAFVAWVTARLGGWNCYYKPPGPKRMRHGWSRLSDTLLGYQLRENPD